jgi:hypothetical protein
MSQAAELDQAGANGTLLGVGALTYPQALSGFGTERNKRDGTECLLLWVEPA